MEKLIVEEICKKYGKSEKLINLMLEDTLNEGYTLKEAVELLELFF